MNAASDSFNQQQAPNPTVLTLNVAIEDIGCRQGRYGGAEGVQK